ncbi:class I SAM-dependent methyltransferase [Gemmata sp.]|uniref:class I SAM-dependent methyltransferase n=1 Tax=Gemmata sp. TaxID=1914242 RepID=UPI003F7221AE
MTTPANVLRTSVGDFPLGECRLAVGGRDWAVLYTAAVVTRAEESRYLSRAAHDLPYGVALWPGAIALSHEIALRGAEFRGRSVMELGAGTGLPGIVAASAGAAVVQSDWSELALHVCRLNGERNGARGIEYREADWAAWADPAKYDWLIGSDILYSYLNHEYLRRIFEGNLAPGGRVLLADPFRAESLPLLEELAAAGWRVAHSRWSIGEGADARPVAVFELAPPGSVP